MEFLKRVRRLSSRIHGSVIETGLFLAVGLSIDSAFLDGNRFQAAALHPFWIIILLTTVQYGTNAGVFATVASTIALLTGNLPEQQVSMDKYTWFSEVSRLPLLWFLTSVILGELRVRQIKERDDL